MKILRLEPITCVPELMNNRWRFWMVITVSIFILTSTVSEAKKSKAFIKVSKKGVSVGGVSIPASAVLPVVQAPSAISSLPIAGPSISQLIDDQNKEIGQISGNVLKEAGIGLGNLDRESRRIGGQVDKNLRKSGNDVGMELKRAQKDTGDLITAVYRYALHEAESTKKVANKFEHRLREGKVVDAIWHLSTDRIQETDGNAAEAAMESEVLSTVASVAASVYGGPGGSAAYAAWLTYHKTCAAGKCNPDLALRVGVIAGASSYANAGAAQITEPVKRAAVTAAIAGAAVAASGGKPSDINDAIFRAGASVLVQEGYRQYVERDMLVESRPALGDPICMTVNPNFVGPQPCPTAPKYMRSKNGKDFRLIDKDGKYHDVPESGLAKVPSDWKLVGDASSTPAGTPVVGIQTDKLPVKSWKNEGSTFMTSAAAIPGMNAMALFHDRWAINWSMGTAATIGSIPVAIILTYTGETLVYDAASSRAIIEAATKPKAGPSPGASATSTRDQHVWLPQSVMCTKGEAFKSFDVAWGTDAKELKCAVVTTVNETTSKEVSWFARVQGDFCSRKIQEMAEPLLKDQWSCKAR